MWKFDPAQPVPEFRSQFAHFLKDAQSRNWGTDSSGVHGNRTLSLEKLLFIMADISASHNLAYSCHETVMEDGHYACRHVWMDTEGGDQVATDWLKGPTVPSDSDWPVDIWPTTQKGGRYRPNLHEEWGKVATYTKRRTLCVVLGFWPDKDYDGLTHQEFHRIMADKGYSQGGGDKPPARDSGKSAPRDQGSKDAVPDGHWELVDSRWTKRGEFADKTASMVDLYNSVLAIIPDDRKDVTDEKGEMLMRMVQRNVGLITRLDESAVKPIYNKLKAVGMAEAAEVINEAMSKRQK